MKTKSLVKTLETLARYEKGQVELKTSKVIPPIVDVRRVRHSLGLSQKEFAEQFGLSLTSVRNWEQGLRMPEGPARLLLALIERNPKLVLGELRKLKAA